MPANRKMQITSSYQYVSRSRQKTYVAEDCYENLPMIQTLINDFNRKNVETKEQSQKLNEAYRTIHELEVEKEGRIVRFEEVTHVKESLEHNIQSVKQELEDTQGKLNSLQEKNNDLDKELVKVRTKLEQASNIAFAQLILSFLATIMSGFGVNILTTSFSDWKGWLVIIVSALLFIVAFLLVRVRKKI